MYFILTIALQTNTVRWPYLVDYLEKHIVLLNQIDDIKNKIFLDKIDISSESEEQTFLFNDELRNIVFSDPIIIPLLIRKEKMNPIDGSTIKKLLTI
jgi:hypothetical protein